MPARLISRAPLLVAASIVFLLATATLTFAASQGITPATRPASQTWATGASP